MKKTILLLTYLFLTTSISCKHDETPVPQKKIVRKQPKLVSYTFENTKVWFKENASDSTKIAIVTAINRTDQKNIIKMDSILIPNDFSGDKEFYLPFPLEVNYLKDVTKILYFSYPTQTFAAYENGILVYTGPTNMGRKADPTPTGLFFTNWKAEQSTSTFNDEWDLKWNFNIANKLGIGFHEYALPGYPASHSCLRLQEKDAKLLYNWADQWVMKSVEVIKVKGTPVIVFGSYPFDAPKPWLQLKENPKSLDISKEEIENQTKAFLTKIINEQKIRTTYIATEDLN